jgi:hypothetical protein
MPDEKLEPFEGQAHFDDMIEAGAPEGMDDTPATNEAAVTAETALSVYSDQPLFDRNEIVLPRLRLAQGLTAEVQDGSAHPGEWLLTGNDPLTAVTFIPLRMTRRRELRGTGDERNTVYCSSLDGVTGQGDPGGSCRECPMADWSEVVEKGKKKRQPPLCTFIYSYLGYSLDHGQIVILEMSRTGLRPAKLLNTIIMQRGLGKFAISLTSNITKDGAKTYAVPIIKVTQVEADKFVEAKAALIAG